MGVVTGGGGGSAFNGGTITLPLTIDDSASGQRNAFHVIEGSLNTGGTDVLVDNNGDLLVQGLGGNPGVVTTYEDSTLNSVSLFSNTGVVVSRAGGVVEVHTPGAANVRSQLKQGGTNTRNGTTGALATTAFVSGTGKQIDTTLDRYLIVPCTLNPTAGAAGTVKVELSPDNVTYSELVTITEPAGVALDGTIIPAVLLVPGAWYVKLTATNATIGTGTYY